MQIADFYAEALQLALRIQERSGPKLKAFLEEMEGDEEVRRLKAKIEAFAVRFPMPAA